MTPLQLAAAVLGILSAGVIVGTALVWTLVCIREERLRTDLPSPERQREREAVEALPGVREPIATDDWVDVEDYR